MRLVECVPNFSEGRDRLRVEEIVGAARAVPGVRILDVEMDADHHRSVVTLVAPPEAAAEAAFRAAAKALALIDLNAHKGEHPRMGAVDVIPFIPVRGTTLEDCVRLARALGERIGRELEVPVYLYGHAAARPQRRDLANVRKGQFEGLKAAIGSEPERAPDFGPNRIHPTAGAVAVGAREQIINFNLNLDSSDPAAGKSIARKVRTSGGGLPELRAKEIRLSDGRMQISTVLTDYRVTSLARVWDAVEAEARASGSGIVSTELVGLVPREALLRFSAERLRARGFDPGVQVLEERLEGGGWPESAGAWTEALACVAPTPGGGSAAAVAGAMGCALAQMALGISLKSAKLEPEARSGLEAAAAFFSGVRSRFLALAGEDAAAFDRVMAALKTPKLEPGRPAAIQAALLGAARTPLDTARTAAEALARQRDASSLAAATVASDMGCAGHLLRCAARCAAENVRINLGSIRDASAKAALETELERLLDGL